MISVTEWNWATPGHQLASIQWNVVDPLKKLTLVKLERSPYLYTYQTAEQLLFELEMRTQIIRASEALADSGASFEVFQTSRCNPYYWQLTPEGGFRLKHHILPSDAIRDIFINSMAYGFECATAIIIVFYKATLESIGEQAFNTLFRNLYLHSWEVDKDLGMTTVMRTDFIPGDAMYIKNPDVNPTNMEYQGENIIDLGNGMVYGHGIGITTLEQVIAALNRQRKPGSISSAYLLKQTTRPNFQYLSAYTGSAAHRNIIAKLGTAVTISNS